MSLDISQWQDKLTSELGDLDVSVVIGGQGAFAYHNGPRYETFHNGSTEMVYCGPGVTEDTLIEATIAGIRARIAELLATSAVHVRRIYLRNGLDISSYAAKYTIEDGYRPAGITAYTRIAFDLAGAVPRAASPT